MIAFTRLNIGAFIIIFGIDILLIIGPFVQNQILFLPILLLLYGIWLIALALMKQFADKSIYAYPPLMVGGWGILIGGTGSLWLTTIYLGLGPAILALGIFVVAVGVIVVAYSFVKK